MEKWSLSQVTQLSGEIQESLPDRKITDTHGS